LQLKSRNLPVKLDQSRFLDSRTRPLPDYFLRVLTESGRKIGRFGTDEAANKPANGFGPTVVLLDEAWFVSAVRGMIAFRRLPQPTFLEIAAA
jgi:hypothetical protein